MYTVHTHNILHSKQIEEAIGFVVVCVCYFLFEKCKLNFNPANMLQKLFSENEFDQRLYEVKCKSNFSKVFSSFQENRKIYVQNYCFIYNMVNT